MCNETEDKRKFEGVWIQKEIWLNADLSLIEKVLFVEIKSLDNENHCTKSNQHFAEFFNCSERTITRGIAKLKELGYIKELAFNGKFRRLCVCDGWVDKMSNSVDHRQNVYTPSPNCLPSNIDSNKDNNNFTNVKLEQPAVTPIPLDKPKNSSKRTPLIDTAKNEDTVSKPVKKKNKYQNCMDITDEIFSDIELRKILSIYLPVRLAMKDKPIYADGWRRLLNTLKDMSDNNVERIKIVEQSIDNGWGKFVRLKKYGSYNNRKKFAEGSKGLKLTKANTEEDSGEIF